MTEPIGLAAWEHEKRDRHGRWTRGGLGIAEQAMAAAPWQFNVPGDPLIGGLAWKERPGRSRLVGRVVGRFAGHVQIDADDGYRHVVHLPSGQTRDKIPLDEAGPGIAAFMRQARERSEAAAADRAAQNEAAEQQRAAAFSPAVPMVTTGGQQQLLLPGMGALTTEYGSASQPVQDLRALAPAVHQVMADYTDPERRGKRGSIDWPAQGQQGATAVVTLPGGTKVITKSQDPLRNDREELAYYVSQAIGGGLPAVARDPGSPRDLIEEYVPGRGALRYALEEETGPDGDTAEDIMNDLMSPGQGSGDIGLLDFLTANSDRHQANVVVDDSGTPHPIDMGMAQFDGLGTDSPYWPEPDIMSMDPWTEDEVGPVHEELAKIQSEFIRLGHPGWYASMIDTLANLTGKPLPGWQYEALVRGDRDTYSYDG